MSIFIVAHITEFRNHLWGHLYTKHLPAEPPGPVQPPYSTYGNYTAREEWEEWQKRFTIILNELNSLSWYVGVLLEEAERWIWPFRRVEMHSCGEKRILCQLTSRKSDVQSTSEGPEWPTPGLNLDCTNWTFQLKRYYGSYDAFEDLFHLKLAKWASVSSETSIKISQTSAKKTEYIHLFMVQCIFLHSLHFIWKWLKRHVNKYSSPVGFKLVCLCVNLGLTTKKSEWKWQRSLQYCIFGVVTEQVAPKTNQNTLFDLFINYLKLQTTLTPLMLALALAGCSFSRQKANVSLNLACCWRHLVVNYSSLTFHSDYK